MFCETNHGNARAPALVSCAILSSQQTITVPGTAPKQMDLSATKDLAHTAEQLATKKIWLPKLLYDSLPWFYLASGLGAFFATLYVSTWHWVLPHYLLFSLACLHLSLAVLRKRRRARRASRDASPRG